MDYSPIHHLISSRIQAQQQIRIDHKLRNLKVELEDMKEYLDNKAADIAARIEELDHRLRSATDRKEGARLLDERARLDKEARDTRTRKLEFENTFHDDYSQRERLLLGKRFLDLEKRLIFSLHFKIC